MPARTPWQKTAEFVDGLKGKLPDWELPRSSGTWKNDVARRRRRRSR